MTPLNVKITLRIETIVHGTQIVRKTPQPPPSACTAQVTTNGSPVIDGGTIQLETISTYGTIGVPPSTLYTGKSFAIEPVNGPSEKLSRFFHQQGDI